MKANDQAAHPIPDPLCSLCCLLFRILFCGSPKAPECAGITTKELGFQSAPLSLKPRKILLKVQNADNKNALDRPKIEFYDIFSEVMLDLLCILVSKRAQKIRWKVTLVHDDTLPHDLYTPRD